MAKRRAELSDKDEEGCIEKWDDHCEDNRGTTTTTSHVLAPNHWACFEHQILLYLCRPR